MIRERCHYAARRAPGGPPKAEPGADAGPAAPHGGAALDWLRLHDLRHGCATFLLAKGVPDRVIMEVLGHAEIGVTMNTYANPRKLHQTGAFALVAC